MTERVLDRAVSASTLLASIPAKQRDAAAKALSSGPWEFHIHRGRANIAPDAMNEKERSLAARVGAMLPQGRTPHTVRVNFRSPTPQELERERKPESVTEITIGLRRGTQLTTRFYRPPSSPWPVQSIAADEWGET